MSGSVLILEDEPLIAWDIEEELSGRGWTVVATVTTVAAAEEKLAEVARPDAALLDINLGNETSFGLARRCAAEGIAVVFLSGESATARPDDLQDVPICSKPVLYETLARTLSGAMSAAQRGGAG